MHIEESLDLIEVGRAFPSLAMSRPMEAGEGDAFTRTTTHEAPTECHAPYARMAEAPSLASALAPSSC